MKKPYKILTFSIAFIIVAVYCLLVMALKFHGFSPLLTKFAAKILWMFVMFPVPWPFILREELVFIIGYPANIFLMTILVRKICRFVKSRRNKKPDVQ